MHTVVIVIHLFIAIGMIALILLQRSEGGALGMGGGPGGLMSGRSAGNILTRSTQILAVAFFATSIALTVFSGEQPGAGTVADDVNVEEILAPQRGTPAAPPIDDDLGSLLDAIPPAETDAPVESEADAPEEAGGLDVPIDE
ncbi:MAG: preprotein translocase subunit SecG [Maricaulaceae bacterium]|jgi:preprotein translocase subunit SecG